MDATQAAKQMAALSAVSQARIANTRPVTLPSGTNSAPLFGATVPPGPHTISSSSSSSSSAIDSIPQTISRLPTSMNNNTFAQRRQNFLHQLASVMASAGTPLPPALIGAPSPNFDPSSSKWKNIELSSEVGTIRLAGRDVGLLQLWGIVFQSGGGHAVAANNGWAAILPQFGLPEEMPQRPPNVGSIPVAQILASIYMTMLYPFEQHYKNNLQDQQKRARQATTQASADFLGSVRLSSHTNPGMQNGLPAQPTSTSTTNGPSSFQPISTQKSEFLPPPTTTPGVTLAGGLSNDTPYDGSNSDLEAQGIKRKIDYDGEGKRTRQRTGSEPPSENAISAISPAVDRNSSTSATTTGVNPQTPVMQIPPGSRQQPFRRRIEYVPLAREVDTYGGRDLNVLENEAATTAQRRPIRDVTEWGTVDIEALTMSVRSRLASELSYALTTLTVLSTMRGPTPGSGFPLPQAPDLFDEILDLLEERAFDGSEDLAEDLSSSNSKTATQRELLNLVHESESQPFAVLQPKQGSRDPSLGLLQRPGDIILAITNVIRNLSTLNDNFDFLSRHTRFIDLMLRLCIVIRSETSAISPASPALSLGDLIRVRRDVLYILVSISPNIQLSTSSPRINSRMVFRSFDLISSYLIDPIDAISPMSLINLTGIPPNGSPKPPALVDAALEVFSHLSQLDSNRHVYAKHIPDSSIICLFEALVHRLPVVDADFQLMLRETWLSYMEKLVIVLYSLAFLAPPHLKGKIKENRSLGLKTIMWRFVQKTLANPESRGFYSMCSRRAVEVMKILDDGEDCFDTSKSAAPTMSFGMGYGEMADSTSEKGTGLLGGHRDVTWDVLMLHEVAKDEVFFGELESLSRVEC
ncbi:hypothetical protein H0H93_002835 [Arthromyces matolae]|nr:hypothetical protein H0H93_002835 [Arthromyces matolae]